MKPISKTCIARWASSWLALSLAQAQSAWEAPFTRVTDSVFDGLLAGSIVGAWADFDNDGWLDLFVGNQTGGGNWLFRNDQTGNLLPVESPPVTTDSLTDHWAASCVDYDNDGWLDLTVTSHNGTAPNYFYRNLGPAGFARLTSTEIGSLATYVSRSLAVAWADYDNDGHLDLFVANGIPEERTPDALFHNEGNGRFTRVTDSPLTTSTAFSFVGSWSDYDNDGDMDLLVVHNLGAANTLFRNDGRGQFVDVTTAAGLGDVGASMGASWGDYDNDGDSDLFVTNVALNQPMTSNFLYRNNGNGTFTRITTGVIAEDQDHFVSGVWFDGDNDGWLDLFVTVHGKDSPTPTSRLYCNQGDGTFVPATVGELVTDWAYAGAGAVGDYNNDGFPDIFVAHGTIFGSQSSALYRNHGVEGGNQSNWIKIRCAGRPSNRSAIGTKLRVKATIGGQELWQMRQIVGSEGALNFNSLEALIGLGDATVIDTLRVEWPSGRVQEFHNLAAKQTLTLVEHTDFSITVAGDAELELTLQGPRQQRYRVEGSPDLTTWSPAASITITNADGTASFTHRPAPNENRMFFRATPE